VFDIDLMYKDTDISGTIKREIKTTIGDLNQVFDDSFSFKLRRVNEFSGTELLGPGLLIWVGIDRNNARCLDERRSIDNAEADTTASKDGDVRALCRGPG
jgi:hypothetical protein